MTDKKCPDCNGELTKIKLIGRGWENPLSGAAIDTELRFYAENQAQRGRWSSMFKPKGRIESFLCNTCGRIFLFGTPTP
jgi:hypothetical protein